MSQTLPAQQIGDLRQTVLELQEHVRMLQAERSRFLRQRRMRLYAVGAAASLVLHIALMIYLAMVQHGGGGGNSATGTASYELAILNMDELTMDNPSEFDELSSGPVEVEASLGDVPELIALAPDSSIATAAPSAIPTLGASGDGSGGIAGFGEGTGGGLGLGGGGGATSFFGIGSKGTRFAYIVDISGSMGQSRKMELAMRELARSVDALPDFSHFYVLLFSSSFVQPPMQKGWMPARKATVRQFISWLSRIDPGGGTEPRSSFLQVFALDVRPDVIYFLTDGQFQDIVPAEIAELNRRGKKVVIHTIQFGDPGGEDVMRQIARDSGGTYRFVPAEAP